MIDGAMGFASVYSTSGCLHSASGQWSTQPHEQLAGQLPPAHKQLPRQLPSEHVTWEGET